MSGSRSPTEEAEAFFASFARPVPRSSFTALRQGEAIEVLATGSHRRKERGKAKAWFE